MRMMKQLAIPILGVTLVSGTLAYAAENFLPECDPQDEETSCQVSGDLAQTPQVDKFKVTCGDRTEICVDIENTGPFFNDKMAVDVKCIVPKQSPTFRAVTPAGGDAQSCVSNCAKAKVEVLCANNLKKKVPLCHDDYSALFDCAWGDIGVEQTGNGNE